jgi:hypothetical protein
LKNKEISFSEMFSQKHEKVYNTVLIRENLEGKGPTERNHHPAIRIAHLRLDQNKSPPKKHQLFGGTSK